ncbi:Qat anti-phage system associated protein QatB [Gluconobacter oxydans]|uniref:Qat anti-phage system associated protein QatB n=1 Tax=Gluconobacter oxydans TaxID=442 RepID=UPI00062C7142|nr:Qat anti-phage system associated protein QatB [Gluconobacter oxydans]
MGTSKGYGGPGSGLVPSWADDPAVPTSEASNGDGVDGGEAEPGGNPDATTAGSFQGARGNFTRFAKTGSDRALGSAMSGYVRTGTGGARQAARRMGTSRASAAGLLRLARDFQQLGATDALARFDLAALAGRPAVDAFAAIAEFVCPPGGSVDEAISRQAMFEAIGDLAELGVGSFESLSPTEMQEFFLSFVLHSIEGRVMADLCIKGITLPDDPAAVEAIQDQLHDFIEGCTRGVFSDELDRLPNLDDVQVKQVVEGIYEDAFELIAAAGEELRK